MLSKACVPGGSGECSPGPAWLVNTHAGAQDIK
jgi:hypothetical protein